MWTSVFSSNEGMKPSSLLVDKALVCFCARLFLTEGFEVLEDFLVRDLTLPGASHFNLFGSFSSYPGQVIPDLIHRLHAGRVKSQTRRRRRHSQQWRLRPSSIIFNRLVDLLS